jgi:hypothetical protein
MLFVALHESVVAHCVDRRSGEEENMKRVIGLT